MTAGRPQWSPGFDPKLPLLPLAFDFASVEELFERRYREEAGHAPSVRVKALQDVKYQPGRRCVATYELEAGYAAQSSRTLGVLSIRETEAEVLLPQEDPELDRLGEALDPQAMHRRFQAIPGLERAAAPPRIEALRYKPRLRCSLRYELDTGDGTRIIFGKMLARDGAQTMSVLTRLHALGSENNAMPRIAPPLAYWPDLRLLLQEAVTGGAELHSVVFDKEHSLDERYRWMCIAGERLAGLHSGAGPEGPSRTLTDDVDELKGYAAAVGAADPELAHAYEAQLGRLFGEDGGGADLVPSHGAFRTDQFMVQGSELVMIDLDGFCWSEPARDVGNLFAYLGWRALRQPHQTAFVRPARDHFLRGYASVSRPPDEARIALFEAASRLKIAGRRYRSLSHDEWPLVPELVESAGALL